MVVSNASKEQVTAAVQAPWGAGAPPQAPEAEERLWGALANVLGLIFVIGPLAAWLIKSESKFVRFNALQMLLLHLVGLAVGILLGVCLTVLAAVPVVGTLVLSVIGPLLGLAGLILLVFLALKAHQGVLYRLPVLGQFSYARCYGA